MAEVHAAPAKVEKLPSRELQGRSANLFGGFGRNPCIGISESLRTVTVWSRRIKSEGGNMGLPLGGRATVLGREAG